MLKALPWRTAAPSWVVPGTVADNCRFLDGLVNEPSLLDEAAPEDKLPLVDEVALVFFETKACLAYTEADLPRAGEHALAFHVHLPMDLPWSDGPESVAGICLELAAKAAHLSPRAFVLHPPADPEVLAHFSAAFQAGCPCRLLLENVEGRDHHDLPALAKDLGLGLCLDLGHLLAYNQQSILEAAPPGLVDMLHLNAPGPGGRHAPITELAPQGEAVLRTMLERLRPGATVVLELFEARALLDSGLRLCQLAARWGLAPAHACPHFQHANEP